MDLLKTKRSSKMSSRASKQMKKKSKTLSVGFVEKPLKKEKMCEILGNKKICADVTIGEKLKIHDRKKCWNREGDSSWMQLIKDKMCAKFEPFLTEKMFLDLDIEEKEHELGFTDLSREAIIKHADDDFQSLKAESMRLIGEFHHISLIDDSNSMVPEMKWSSTKPRKDEPYIDGNYNLPDRKPANEVNFMGGLGPAIGNPRSKTKIERPTYAQIIHNMRNRNQPIFTFSEDPKVANCCVKKIIKSDQTNPKLVKKIVDKERIVDNINTPPPSEISESPTEIFDGDNPTNLNFQGFDAKETYQNDEQDIQNRREYFSQKNFMDKINLRKEIVYELEEIEKVKKYGMPDFFNMDIKEGFEEEKIIKKNWEDNYMPTESKADPHFERPLPDAIPFVPSVNILAYLKRTRSKLKNVAVVEDITEKRRQRFKKKLSDKQEKENQREKEQEQEAVLAEENKVFTLGEKDFEDYFKNEYKEILERYNSLPPIYKEKKYPHTLREVKELYKKMELYKREVRDKAQIKEAFLESINKTRYLKEAKLEVSDDLEKIDIMELSEQSSDDEDGLSIGRKSYSKYQLRGFKYKLDMEPRGKFDIKHKRKEDRPPRTCMERMQWFDELAPEAQPNVFYKKNSTSLPSAAQPFDENYILFKPERFLPKPIEISAIKEIINNPSIEPTLVDPKPIKTKKPKYVKVKKFNLTGYLYGTNKVRKEVKSHNVSYNKYGMPYYIIEKCDENFEKRQNMLRRKRNNRMRVLGIPYIEYDYGKKKNNEYNKSDSDSDWVPDVEDDVENEYLKAISTVTIEGSEYPRKTNGPSLSVTNMVAPQFREPTLREHPRRKRFASLIENATISSTDSQFYPISNTKFTLKNSKLKKKNTDCSIDSRSPYNVPRMQKLDEDNIFPSNLETPPTDFYDLFEGRHHHYHYDHAQHKQILVNYAPKIPKFSPLEIMKKIHKKLLPFERANPRGNDPKDLRVDKSMPMFQYIKITGGETEQNKNTDNEDNENNQVNDAADDEDDEDAPNKLKYPLYSSALKKTRSKYNFATRKIPFKDIINNHFRISKQDWGGESDEIYEYAKKNEYLETLKKEQESIKSCFSSESSSVHSNFTKDSGSFLMLQGKKVPCDFITKSYVPFEEVDRSRVKAGPLDHMDEYYGPYYTVPFSGQKLDMKKITKPKDKFFTSLVRSRFGIRDRLKVNVPLVNDELIGKKQRKYISRLATEWDNYYQHEIRNRPHAKRFKPRSILELTRNALRKHFQTLNIRISMIEHEMIHDKETKFAKEVIEFQQLCLPLFNNWEETYYRRSMRKLQNLKPFLEKSDLLKKELNEIQKQETKVNMAIVYLEDDWIRRTRLQNFHYLIMKLKWREENDWMHRKPDGTLENFRESIQNRATTNIRVRDVDNAWAVKEFYENYYLKQNHKIEVLFMNTMLFEKAIVRLKMRSYMCLVELHFSSWVLANISHGYYSFQKWAENYIEKRTKYVRSSCAKKYFMQDRAASLEADAKRLMGKTIYNCVASKLSRTLVPLCEVAFVNIIPAHIRGDLKEDSTIIDKFGLIVNCVHQLLAQLDTIPSNKYKPIEEKTRKKNIYLMRNSKRACAVENRIEYAMVQMRRNMGPPFVKPKRVGKLPRSYNAPKKRIIKAKPVVIPSKALLFLDAFTDETTADAQLEGQEAIDILKSIEDNCIPFYFDHFLMLHDYFPTYDFPTQIQLREGSEENLLYYKDVLPNVMNAVERWQARREKQMNDQIKKTWYLYVDKDM